MNLKPINSCFRYPGGKSKPHVRKQILAYMPSAIQEYREPFVGGGGIFFSLPAVKSLKRRWINDINCDLISVYRALRDRAEDFIGVCRQYAPPRDGEPEVSTKGGDGAKYNARLGDVFKRFAEDANMDPALRYFFINRTVWAGRVNYELVSRLYYSNPTGWNIVERPGYLEQVAAHLQGTRISSGSYEELLSEPGDDVWVYLDPPYYVDTEMAKTDKQYQFGFSEDQHRAFAAACRATKHKVCISYDDCKFIRDLYDGFHIHEHQWTYFGTSSAKRLKTKKPKPTRKELIITNYKKPGQQMVLPFQNQVEDVDCCAGCYETQNLDMS